MKNSILYTMDLCKICIFIVILLAFFKKLVSPKICKKNEECSKRMRVKGAACTFCFGEIGSAECFYDQRYIVDPKSLNCRYNLLQCKVLKPCKNGGKCYGRYEEIYTCECAQGFIGRNCDMKYDGIKYFFMFDLLFEISAPMYHYTQVQIIVTMSKDDWLSKLEIITEDGYYAKIQKSDNEILFNKGLGLVNRTYKAGMRFIYKPYNVKNKDFKYLGRDVLGYFTKFQLDIVHKDTRILTDSFKLFVSYPQKNVCVPIVKLSGCSVNYKKPTAYYRWSEIRISSSASIIPNGNSRTPFKEKDNGVCGSESGITLTWKIFWLLDETSKPETLVVERFKDKTITINPLTDYLECGLYRVELQGKNVFSEGSSESYDVCYFEIATLPLEAVIEGGTHRSVAKKDGLLLSAVNSKDPNELPEGESITTKWSCAALKFYKENIGGMCETVVLKQDKPYFIPPAKLIEGEYNFTLEIWADWYKEITCSQCALVKEHAFSYQIVVVANKTNLLISCQVNCGKRVSVNNELILKVSYLDNTDELPYKWTCIKVGGFNQVNPNFNDYPTYIFKTAEDTLDTATSYKVLVEVMVNGDHLSASYSFETDDFIYSGSCSTVPNTGIRGITYFDIKCATEANKALMFEFFDKTPEEASQNIYMKGRMLGTSNTGELQAAILTRGVIVVFIISGSNRIKKLFEINLTDDNDKIDALLNKILHTPLYFQNQPYPLRMQLISSVLDVSTNNNTQKMLLDVLLKFMIQREINLVEDVKDNSLLLYNTLLKLGKGNMDIRALKITRKLVDRMTKVLKSSVTNIFKPTNVKETKEIMGVMLNILELSLEVQNGTEVDGTSKYITTDTFSSLSYVSGLLGSALRNIQIVLSVLQKPGLPPSEITSDSSSFVFKAFQDDPTYNYNISKMLQYHPDIPVTISQEMLNYLHEEVNEEEVLSLNIGIINKNLFEWFDKQSVSNLLMINLQKHTKEKGVIKIGKITSTVDMNVYFDNTIRNLKEQVSQTIPLQLNSDENNLDLQIRVHRLDPAPGSNLVVTFLYPPTNVTLRVLILENYRPTYKMMISDSTVISQESPYYFPNFSAAQPNTFYYMGVLPGLGLPLSHSSPFSFAVNSTSCVSWERVMWSTSGCAVGPNTNGHIIHCQCNHLSILGAIFPFMPTLVDPFADAKLFLTVKDNPIVVSLMITLLVMYIILSIFSYNLDKKDRFRGIITVLEDNYPQDKFPYVLAVYTSTRFFSGTSANVGVKLIGQLANSRPHILSSRFCKVMTRQSDDWFLILCPRPLGLIQYLHLWHDNSGICAGWYCDKVHVYDINNCLECLFLVDQWIELNVNTFPEALIVPASGDDILKIDKVLDDNISKCVRERGSAMGIFTQHPRSTVRRLQRVNIFMCSLSAAMLCSIMFYTDAKKNKSDYFGYKLKMKDLYVSFIMIGVVFAVEYVVCFLFKKSFKCVPVKNRNHLYLRKSFYFDDYFEPGRKSDPASIIPNAEEKKNTRDAKGLSKQIAKTVKHRIKTQDLTPAVLPHGNSGIEVNKFWLTLTWATCAVIIILCAYLIMLYGLKMGLVRSKQWISSIVISYVHDKVVLNPVSILIIAVSITVSLGYITGSSSYRVTEGDIQMSMAGVLDDNSLEALVHRRQHPMYSPIRAETREGVMKKKLIFFNCINVLQIFLSLCYIITVVYTVQHIRHLHFERNNHLRTMINTAREHGKMIYNFYDAYYKEDLSRYFRKAFLKIIYKNRWYNSMPLYGSNDSLIFWTSDYSWRMVGVPYLRQQRVYEEPCSSFVEPLYSCIPELSPQTEDSDTFGIGWSMYDSWRSSSDGPWAYSYPTANWLKTFYRLQGRSGKIYDNGGYKAKLGSSIQETVKVVAQLVDKHWVDKFTKVVFVELTFYNVNLHCLGQLTLILELLTTGVSVKAIRIESVIVDCSGLKFRHISFIVLTSLFFLEICYKVNNIGFTNFLKNIRNILLLVIVIPSVFVIIAFFVNLYFCMVYDLCDRYFDKKHNLFDFDRFVSFSTNIMFLLSFFLIFGIFRTMLLLQLIRSINVVSKIHKLCKLSSRTIFNLLLLMYILLFFLSKILITLDINQMVMDLIVSQKKSRFVHSEAFSIHSYIFSVVKFSSMVLISSCFITFFIHFNPMSRVKGGENWKSLDGK